MSQRIPGGFYLAHANPDGSFCKNEDPFLDKLLEQQGLTSFSNKFRSTRLVCVACFAEMHKPELKPPAYKPYFTVDAEGSIKLESIWINAQRKTKSTKARSKRLDRILKQFAAQAKKDKEENQHVTAEWLRAKYDELVKEGGRPATDWVCKLGVDCWILY